MNALERLERANPVTDSDRLLSASGAMDDFVLAVKERSGIMQTTDGRAPIEVPETQVQETDPIKPVFKKERRRGLVYAFAVATIALIFVGVAWAVLSNDSQPDVAPQPTPTPTTLEETTQTTVPESSEPLVELPAGIAASVVGAVSPGIQPCDVQIDGDGFAWVSMNGNPQLAKLDPVTGATLASYPVSQLPCEMAFLDGSLWVSHFGGRFNVNVNVNPGATPNTLDRIDPATGEVVAGIDLDTVAWDLEAADGSIWASLRSGGTVVRIDPATNAVVAEIAAGAGTMSGLASTPGTVWVASEDDIAVVGIDTSSNDVSAVIALPLVPKYLVAADDALWVSTSDRKVFRIDLGTNEVGPPIDINDLPLQLSVADGYIWVAGESDGILTRIDPATSETTELQLTAGTYAAEPVGSLLWIPDYTGTEIYFLDPGLVE